MNYMIVDHTIPIVPPQDILAAANSLAKDFKLRDYASLLNALGTRMGAYDGAFGPSMILHQGRVANDFSGFLLEKGYDADSIFVLDVACLFHDLGKALQREGLYGMDDKPTDAIKAERTQHVFLGPKILAEEIASRPDLQNSLFVGIMACIQQYHHDRYNGNGPNALLPGQLGEVMEILGIFDTIDGKAAPRSLAPSDPGYMERLNTKIPGVLREMTGDPRLTERAYKHAGEFRPTLLKEVAAYYEKKLGIRIDLHGPDASPTLAFS